MPGKKKDSITVSQRIDLRRESFLVALFVISSESRRCEASEHTNLFQGKFEQVGWCLEELHPTLGAQITGVTSDPSSFSPEQRTLLAAALATYELLVFPDQVTFGKDTQNNDLHVLVYQHCARRHARGSGKARD